MDDLSQIERLAVDIDFRLIDLWLLIMENEKEPDAALIASWVRVAYARGYLDGQQEPHGKLERDNGFRVPERIDE